MGGGGMITRVGEAGLEDEFKHNTGEAFADDLTVLFKLREGALRKILKILADFGELSGLKINMEKTHIMVTGREWTGGDEIEGIRVKRECKLLGLLVDNKVSRLQANWDECIRKIRGLINFWGQFNMTVSGRVMVSKTFLLSQVTFYLGIIPISKNVAENIEQMIEKFVLDKMQMARDRIYNKIEQGGIGPIRISEMDVALKSSWVNRWLKEGVNKDSTGKVVFGSTNNGKVELIDKNRINKSTFPTAYTMAAAWSEWRKYVYENDGNLFKAQIFGNPGLTNRYGRKIGENNVLSRRRYNQHKERLEEIKLLDLVEEDGIKPRNEIAGILGLEMTEVEYGKLRDVIKLIRGKFRPEWDMREKGKNVIDILKGVKKGSKKLRAIMSGRGSRKYRNFDFDSIRPINTLWRQLDLEMDITLVACGNTLWNIKEVNAEFRQFMLKWNQGMIYGNTVISHFGENVDRKCTMCKIRSRETLTREMGREPTEEEMNRVLIPDEDRLHIYWECPVIRETFSSVYRGIWGDNARLEKKDFLMGKIIWCMEGTQLFMLVNMFIKYKVWRYKLAGVIPNAGWIAEDTKKMIKEICQYKN